MRIAFFTDSYLPQINGVTYAVDTFAKGLTKNGHKVEIFAPSYGQNNAIHKVTTHSYSSIPFPGYKDLRIVFPRLISPLLSIKKFQPDIVHLHSPGNIGLSAILIAKLLKIPLIGTYHTIFSEQLGYLNPLKLTGAAKPNRPETLPQKATWKVINSIYSSCNVIIAPSKSIADELTKRGVKRPIKIISNGIDLSQFPNKNYFNQGNKLLYVGRIGYEKNIDIVIESFQLVQRKQPETTLTIVGDGPNLKSLKDLSKKLKLSGKIKFTGKLPREQLSEVYRSHDIFVTASAMEIQPLTVLEAMASGLPIVGVRKYGLIDLVEEDKNGYLVESYDKVAMADRIIKIVSSNSLAKKFGKRSRIIAENNNADKSIKKLENLYLGLCHR